jgi:hypothetical protein
MAVSEEQLAAAIMAKIAGGNLKKVDESSLSPVTPGMNANRIDPMSFVRQAIPAQSGPTPQQIQMMEHANKQAEMLYPLPQADLAPIPQMPPVTPPSVPTNTTYSVPAAVSNSVITREDIVSIRSQLERTNATLTKMSGMLGKVFASFTEKNKLSNSD